MTQRAANAARPPLLVLIGIAAGGVVSLVALVGMALIAWGKVQSGRGWESYRTHWLVEFNWVGFLVLLAVVGLALCVGLFFRLREWREIKELEREYGAGRHG
jgi:hypothetical protein